MHEQRQFCTMHLAGHLVGVEVMRIQEVISYQTMTHVPLATDVVAGLINLRGQIVTALDLRRRLELPDRPDEMLPMNVVVQAHSGPVSLLVDQIGDVVDVDDAMFEPVPETFVGATKHLVRGVYKLGDRLLLDLDVDAAIDINASMAGAR